MLNKCSSMAPEPVDFVFDVDVVVVVIVVVVVVVVALFVVTDHIASSCDQ